MLIPVESSGLAIRYEAFEEPHVGDVGLPRVVCSITSGRRLVFTSSL